MSPTAGSASSSARRRRRPVRIAGERALDRDRGRRRATAMRRASRRRPASRMRSSFPSPARSTACWRGGPGRHGPFLTPEPARALGPAGRRRRGRARTAARRRTLLRGEFRPGGAEREWCDPEVLRPLRRRRWRACGARSSRSTRRRWRGSCRPGRASRRRAELPPLRGSAALERLAEVVDQLAGVPIPASVLERDVLPARVPGYQPRLLDELGAMGEVGWVGRGSLGRDDGRIVARTGRAGKPCATSVAPPEDLTAE